MKGKRVWVAYLVLFIAIMFIASVAYAGGQSKCKGKHKSFSGKIFSKMFLAIKNQEALGLSDEQFAKIKDLKIKTKKDLVQKKADIEIVAIDIKALMWEDTIDTKAANNLIDKKYELKKAKAKYLMGAYAAFKNILSAEQKKEFQKICYNRGK
jgi:Spy/CpxP family protein refolding chaperone